MKKKDIHFFFILDLYKPPFNPIHRPWGPSRWHEIEKYFILHLSRPSQRLLDAHSCQNTENTMYFWVWSGLLWSGLVWLHGYHAWISSMNIIHACHPQISSLDIIHRYHPWISSMDIIHGYYSWILSMDHIY